MVTYLIVHIHKISNETEINKFKWNNVEQYFFKKVKRIVTRRTLLNYPGSNETFKIFTDDSVLQLRAVII